MPMPVNNWNTIVGNLLIAEQCNYNAVQERQSAAFDVAKMNRGQKHAFDSVVSSVDRKDGELFFLNGPAGTGKMFCYNAICHKLQGDHKIVLCVASSGIAALLLQGGRTSYSTFKIPLDVHEDSVCNICKNTILAQLLAETDLIIWDEAPMQDQFAPEAVDRTLQDVLNNEKPSGRITVVFGGDFRQIQPVKIKGTREVTVSASLQKSHLWRKIKVLSLTENMHLARNPENATYAQWLLDVGNGKLTAEDGSNLLSKEKWCGDTVESLLEVTYPGVAHVTAADPLLDAWFGEHTILCARNDDVDDLNSKILDKFPGQLKTFRSADKAIIEEGADQIAAHYSTEYLNSINASGLPLAELKLKIGCCPVMIL